jgi:hypothetical protein
MWCIVVWEKYTDILEQPAVFIMIMSSQKTAVFCHRHKSLRCYKYYLGQSPYSYLCIQCKYFSLWQRVEVIRISEFISPIRLEVKTDFINLLLMWPPLGHIELLLYHGRFILLWILPIVLDKKCIIFSCTLFSKYVNVRMRNQNYLHCVFLWISYVVCVGNETSSHNSEIS